MSPVKIFIIFATIFAASLAGDVCPAQVVRMANTFHAGQLQASVHFSLTSSNKIMTVGSTNLIHCQIQSLSTNGIIIDSKSSPYLISLVSMTNGTHPVWEELPQQPNRQSNYFLVAGGKYEWDELVVIPNNITPKRYNVCILKSIIMPALKEDSDGVNVGASVKDVEIVK